ncbi:MAG TPA: response regulator transcription factor [Pyrinomonadaceae bacterium]|nr:response regulator transcription factor [Pyrinomonadaceae bacterium]
MQPLRRETENIRILLVDNQAVVRSGIRMLIESQPGMMVVAEVENQESVNRAAAEQLDVILLAINEDSDLNVLPQLLAVAGQAQVLILTDLRDPGVHQRAVCLGAMGLVLKDTPSETFIKAIQKVSTGEVWLNRSITANVLTKLVRVNEEAELETAKISSLTKREREIITLIGEGLKNRQISARLFISEATVRHHLTSIFDKLDVSDRLELIIYAFRHSLIKPLVTLLLVFNVMGLYSLAIGAWS